MSRQIETRLLTHQNDIRDEATLKESDESPAGQEGLSSLQPELCSAHNAPENHLCGNPSVSVSESEGMNAQQEEILGRFVRANLLADELGRQLSQQERNSKYSLS